MSPGDLPPFLFVVAVIVAAVTWQSLRRPVLRRLAIRNLLRRPSEAALVVGGSLLGTALITGSFIVGDTLDASIRATAHTQLGPIDELIVIPDVDRGRAVVEAIEAIDDPRIDGVLGAVGAQGSVVAGEGESRRSEPEVQILETDFTAARSFGGDPEATGIDGDTPRPGEVAITDDLADALDVDAGERVTAFLYGSEIEFEVDRVLPRLGVAGFWLGPTSKSMNAFVAPGTITGTAGEVPAGAFPPTAFVLISNRGGVEDGVGLTDEVSDRVENNLPGGSLRVDPVKRERLESAELQGQAFSEIFLAIGAFAIMAGILLLVNIFVMLAEERKSQLGMLRAVGLRRGDLVRSFVIEGFSYCIAAGILGAAAGIFVGWAIAIFMAPIFSGLDEFSLELRFALEPASVVGGFCLGVMISFLTIFFTSFRISRINIIAAIRELPDVKVRKPRLRTYVLGGLGAALGAAWFTTALVDEKAWLAALIAPVVVVFGLLPTLSRLLGRRAAVLIASGFSLFWGIFGNALLGNRFFEAGEVFAFVVQGVLLTFAAVVFLSQTQETFEGAIRRIAARNLPLRLGIAYPLARRFRTGLTLGMYSLVIFTMTFIAVMSAVFGGQVENFVRRGAGEFDVMVSASQSNPPSVEELQSVDGVAHVAPLTTGFPLWRAPDDEPTFWPATGIDSAFVSVKPPAIEERPPEFASDRDVWTRLLEDPNAVVAPTFFLQEEGGPPEGDFKPGDEITVVNPATGEEHRRTILALLGEDISFGGVHMSQESLKQVLGSLVATNKFYIDTGDSESEARSIAARLQGKFFRNGVKADSARTLTEEFQAVNLQFLNLMQGYLALGLIVGIAGLGVVMVRSVRERRREIGVLRSLGFVAPQVRRAFLLESGLTALQGILVGATLALITAAQLIETGEFGETAVFTIPWNQLALVGLGALGASLLATAWPAHQASTIPPAVALRTAE